MVKRIYIISVFIANLILLASSVIPHHHHNGNPHFVVSGMNQHDEGDNCSGGKDDEQTCLLEQKVDAVYEQSEQKCHDASCVLHHPKLFLYDAVFPFLYDFSFIREIAIFPKLPCLISYYCDYVSAGMGLRAPPM